MIKIFKNISELSQYTASSFVEIANQSIAKHGFFLSALCGGNTPLQLYELLGNSYYNQVDWAHAHFFWGDERCVPINDTGNSYGQTKKVLFDKINIPIENIHRINSDLEPAKSAADYAQVLKQFASPTLAWPRFDLVFLGMGNDGHTASLFPGSPVNVDVPTLPVTANYQDRPANRVTITQVVFNSASNIFFLVTGSGKAETLRNVLHGEYKPDLYPAQRINPQNGQLIWLIDEAAASKLKK